MNQAQSMLDKWTTERQFELGGKVYKLHQITAEEAAFMVGFSSTVAPMIKQNKMFFMTHSVDMVSEHDFDSITAIKGWSKAKPIINKAFTVDGQSIDKAVEPFSSGENMLQFYTIAMTMIAKS